MLVAENKIVDTQQHQFATQRGGLECVDVECCYNDITVFSGISFSLSSGDIMQVEGSNGSGKSSLLRILSGLKAATAGEVLWQGVNIQDVLEDYRPTLTYLSHKNGIKPDLNVMENLSMEYVLAGQKQEVDIATILNRLKLSEYSDSPAQQLSSGQLRRLAVARFLISSTKIWLMDEPYTSLDTPGKSLVQELLRAHSDTGGISVIATHECLAMDNAKKLHLG